MCVCERHLGGEEDADEGHDGGETCDPPQLAVRVGDALHRVHLIVRRRRALVFKHHHHRRGDEENDAPEVEEAFAKKITRSYRTSIRRVAGT